jgi:hypothetical protein
VSGLVAVLIGSDIVIFTMYIKKRSSLGTLVSAITLAAAIMFYLAAIASFLFPFLRVPTGV